MSYEDPWRLYVRLKSRRVMKQFMDYQELSGRGLARKAGLSESLVNHLVRDPRKFKNARNTCSLATAHAIEEALGCPKGFLFAAEVSNVTNSTVQRQKKEAA